MRWLKGAQAPRMAGCIKSYPMASIAPALWLTRQAPTPLMITWGWSSFGRRRPCFNAQRFSALLRRKKGPGVLAEETQRKGLPSPPTWSGQSSTTRTIEKSAREPLTKGRGRRMRRGGPRALQVQPHGNPARRTICTGIPSHDQMRSSRCPFWGGLCPHVLPIARWDSCTWGGAEGRGGLQGVGGLEPWERRMAAQQYWH